MSNLPRTAPRFPWLGLAAEALTASTRDDRAHAARCVQRLVAAHGTADVPRVMLCWIDTVLIRAGHRADGTPIAIAFQHEGSDTVQTADEVPPAVRWAGRFFAARAADDEPQARALVNSVESDEQWGANVLAVLDVCGALLRRMGWTGADRADD